MIDFINNSVPPKVPVGGSQSGTSASQAKSAQAAPAPNMADTEVSVIGAKVTVAELAKTPRLISRRSARLKKRFRAVPIPSTSTRLQKS